MLWWRKNIKFPHKTFSIELYIFDKKYFLFYKQLTIKCIKMKSVISHFYEMNKHTLYLKLNNITKRKKLFYGWKFCNKRSLVYLSNRRKCLLIEKQFYSTNNQNIYISISHLLWVENMNDKFFLSFQSYHYWSNIIYEVHIIWSLHFFVKK